MPTDILTGPSSKSLRAESHCTTLSKWRQHQLPLHRDLPVRRPSPGERNTTASSRDHTLQLYNLTAREGSSSSSQKFTNECYIRSPYSVVEDLAKLKWAEKLVEDIHGRSQSYSICPGWLESYRERRKDNRSCHGNKTGREKRDSSHDHKSSVWAGRYSCCSAIMLDLIEKKLYLTSP